MTIPEKTGVWTVQGAMRQMARQLEDSRFIRLAESNTENGSTFEVVLTIKRDENGYLVSMNGYGRKKAKQFGTLMRLQVDEES